MKHPFQAAKLADVARRAGVGNATASRALNGGSLVSERTRQRILEAARDLDYLPNRSAQVLKGGRTGMIGMVIPRMSHMFFAGCVDAVQAIAGKHASQLVVASTHDSTERMVAAVRQLLQHKVDGLVLAHSEYLTPSLVTLLKALPVPIVGIDAPLTRAELPSVLIDNAAKARLATQHLIEHGYRRITEVQLDPALYTMKERRHGYEQAMHEAGLEPEQQVISGRAGAEDLLRTYRGRVRSYAVLAANEDAAKHMAAAAKKLGMRMPEDFGMISFDDFDLSDVMETPLTVVRQPVSSIGQTAANILFGRMRDHEEELEQEKLETVIQAQLIVRRSCGCE